MTVKINGGFFFCSNILYWTNSLHHIDKCALSLYLATEHNCSPISFEQFQKVHAPDSLITPLYIEYSVSLQSHKELKDTNCLLLT